MGEGFFLVEPEVAGGVGPSTRFEIVDGRRIVVELEYRFDGWLGDPLLETTPCFILTATAQRRIEAIDASGVKFAGVKVARSGLFRDLHGNRELPEFSWMQIFGTPGVDDFGLTDDLMLVVSARALETLREEGLSHALIEPFEN